VDQGKTCEAISYYGKFIAYNEYHFSAEFELLVGHFASIIKGDGRYGFLVWYITGPTLLLTRGGQSCSSYFIGSQNEESKKRSGVREMG
jgi:hypothetical protein